MCRPACVATSRSSARRASSPEGPCAPGDKFKKESKPDRPHLLVLELGGVPDLGLDLLGPEQDRVGQWTGLAASVKVKLPILDRGGDQGELGEGGGHAGGAELDASHPGDLQLGVGQHLDGGAVRVVGGGPQLGPEGVVGVGDGEGQGGTGGPQAGAW